MDLLQRRLLPSIASLVTLDAVARRGSFSAAAQELNLTQGAISRQIAALEEQLGTALCLRNGRGVTLTARGEAYHRSIQQALSIIRAASLEAMTGAQDNKLDLAIPPTFGTRWLLPRIPRFVAAYPQITLNFATRIGQFDFEAEGIDAAIHIGGPNWPRATATFLMDETVAPVCSPEFLKRHAIAGPADLLRLPLIQMKSRPLAWGHWFESLGLEVNPSAAMGFEQFMAVAQACIAGLGVALMPLFLIRPELQSGQLVVALDHRVKSQSHYYLVAPDGRPRSMPLKAFSDWLLQEVADFSGRSPEPE
ncbi:LysR family transcriptional regulator [Rhizobium paknamense]|uniref:DNA-binding transcriptional LysR family regulator n=1 Tax=Rhizobium paknamense TaxID=1206817 RepID=A0ABU0IL29_9HYPH|nr:LysR family transcriptional regulator [Rhizobium paknamense]MDQ0457899.1 DNA-binding transcriptional LysR family regulator [Rhizobium paknamense]